jgi:hypothetical protein
MNTGKVLMFLGALITLVSTYIFSFYYFGFGIYGWGIGAWTLAFQAPIWTSGDYVVIIVEIVIILFLLAGVFQLIGIANRWVGFFGSLLVLGGFIYFMLIEFSLISTTAIYALLFAGYALGPLPIHVQVGSFMGLGAWLLIGGWLLGFIGTFTKRD